MRECYSPSPRLLACKMTLKLGREPVSQADGERAHFFAPVQNAAAASTCINTLGDGFAHYPRNTLYATSPDRYAAFWRGLALDLLDGVPAEKPALWNMDDGKAAALCYIWEPGHNGDFNQSSSLLRRDALQAWADVGEVFDRVERQLYADHGPFYTLDMIAVQPSTARQGLGRRLLKQILSVADREQRYVFLAAMGPDNRDWYRRYGFTEFQQYTFAVPGLDVVDDYYFMKRTAVPNHDGT